MAKRWRASSSDSRDDGIERNVNKEEDRLSHLPANVLTDILSRLSTVEAVRTSVLSRKWTLNWITVYNLNFVFDDFDGDLDDDNNENNNDNNNDNNDDNNNNKNNDDDSSFSIYLKQRVEKFCNFVDRALILHGGAGPSPNYSLNRFTLRCSLSATSSFTGVSRITHWLAAAFTRDVRTLEIDFPKASLVLPFRRTTNCDLQELRLLSQITLTVPNDNLFSTLRTIDFNYVKIKKRGRQGNGSGGRRRLVLKFPVLEYLHIRYCKWIGMTSVKFDAPLLTEFNMTYDGYLAGGGNNNNNYRLLQGFVFEICSPKLVRFKANGNLTENYILPKKCSIQTAIFHLFMKNNWSASGHRVAGTLKQMNVHLKHLVLSGATLTGLQQASQISFLPLFQNLIHLEICAAHYVVTDAGAIVRLLHRTPLLQTLTIDMTTKAEKDMRYKEGDEAERVPECLITNLKVVNFICFYSRLNVEEDISFLRFILKNARVLQEIQLINNKARNVQIPAVLSLQIQLLLLSSPKLSNDAQIFLVT